MALYNRALVLVLWAGMTLSSRGSVRVALLDVICEDNSYRSTLTAADFTAALQANLSGENAFDWVERAELGKAEAELRLGHFGLIDRAEAVRSGRWVKADWAVLGTISTNRPAGRTLRLEIVDLRRADWLATSEFVFAPQVGNYFRFAPSDLAKASATLRSALSSAERGYNETQQPSVALLFLAGAGLNSNSDDLEDRLRLALGKAAAKSGRFHLVQFERPGVAMDEANLVLNGLAESQSNAWEKIADQYMWGFYSFNSRKSFDGSTRQWLTESSITVSLNLWNTKHEPTVVAVTLTNATSEDAVVARVMNAVEPLLGRVPSGLVEADARTRHSESLVKHAVEIATKSNGLPGAPGRRQQWLQLVQILETACFFNPGNQAARELWARVRWGPSAKRMVDNEFFFARRRSDVWRKHVEQFGFESTCPNVRSGGWWETNSIGSEYLQSAWRPFEMFQFSQYNQAQWGVPRDAGGPELHLWQQRFGREFYTRLLAAPDDATIQKNAWNFFYGALTLNGDSFVVSDPRQRTKILERLWPLVLERQRAKAVEFDDAYSRALRLHFQQMGQPGGEHVWLDQLGQIAAMQREKDRAKPVHLPAASELDGNFKP